MQSEKRKTRRGAMSSAKKSTGSSTKRNVTRSQCEEHQHASKYIYFRTFEERIVPSQMSSLTSTLIVKSWFLSKGTIVSKYF